ncbi:MAG TPA: GDSL-type esterase/lipase family protein [Solirubrobacteraceae bacterium]|nr:GDSL-type esterase/lipase family protein [Solirubrobacteraceae bacterium]
MHDQPAHHGRRHRPHRRAHLAAGLIGLALAALLALEPRPAAAERILVTGDSMMYVMQHPLARRLRALGHEVKTDGRFGTGITKPHILDWQEHAIAQASEFHPEATFMFIGANDLFPIAGARCCGERWVELYARRARRIIRIYGRTVWLTLPAPRDRGLARGFRAVNRAIRRATTAERATLLDLVPVFTPGWRYRRTMRWEGRRVVVRQLDGVHLGHEGVKIASDLAVAALGR